MTSVAYLDASALVKLVIPESDSVEMHRWYVDADRIITSRVGIIETRRAVARTGLDARAVRRLVTSVEVFELDESVSDRAATVGPTLLRALDAIHVATALELGDVLDAFVTYDDRMAAAARAVGLPVVRPA